MMPTETMPLKGNSAGLSITRTFNIELLRVIGLSGLFLVFLVGGIITQIFVNPIIRPETTEIYRIFGFNHLCNIVDHNPAREIAAIMLPLSAVPLSLFYVLLYFRMQYLAKIGKIPTSLYTYTKYTTPYNILAFSLMHMWMVNSPDRDYGFMFHWVPYAAVQWATVLTGIQQVWYHIAVEQIPFGFSCLSAKIYLAIFIGFTCYSQFYTITTVFFSEPGEKERSGYEWMEQYLSYFYFCFLTVFPAIFSYGTIKDDGLMDKITYQTE